VSINGKLETVRSGLQRSIRRSFVVTFRSGYGVGFVILRSVGGVARIGFGVEV
jgi:hypothetical protein